MSRANPFLALRSYTRDDRLFGRDTDLVILKSRLLSGRSVLLFAASGTGKTSFLNARLGPAVETDWRVIQHSEWAAQAPLAAVIAKTQATLLKAGLPVGDEPRGILELLENSVEDSRKGPRRFLFILDQFEEVFQHWRDLPAIDRFAEELARITESSRVDARVLFSMREEFLGELSLFDTLIPDLFGNSYRLKNPSREQTGEIIERTAGKVSEEGLTALLDDLVRLQLVESPASREDQPGVSSLRNRVAPPFLQIVCHRIWEREMVSAPEDAEFLGGYKKSRAEKELRDYCNEKLDQALAEEERDLASEAFGYLMTRRGAKMAYELDNLAEHMKRPRTELKGALEKLSHPDVRILREFQGGSAESQWFELYHDIYAPFLFDWKAGHDRERRRKEEERLKRELKAQAEEESRRELKRARLMQKIGYALVALVVIGFVARVLYRDYRNVTDWVNGVSGSSYANAVASTDLLRSLPFMGSRTRKLWFDLWKERAERAALAEKRDQAILYGLLAAKVQAAEVDLMLRRELGVWTGGTMDHLVQVMHFRSPVSLVDVTADGNAVVAFAGGKVYRWDRGSAKAPSESAPLRFPTRDSGSRGGGFGANAFPESNDQGAARIAARAFSADGAHLLAYSRNETGLFLSTGGQPVWRVPNSADSLVASFSPDGSWVAIVQSSQLQICAVAPVAASAKQCRQILAPRAAAFLLVQPVFSPDSAELAVARRGTVTFWNAATGGSAGAPIDARQVMRVLYLGTDRIVVQQPGAAEIFDRRQGLWTRQGSMPVPSGTLFYQARLNRFASASSTSAAVVDASGNRLVELETGDLVISPRFTPDGNLVGAVGAKVAEWSLQRPTPATGPRIVDRQTLRDISPEAKAFVTSGDSGVALNRFDDPAFVRQLAFPGRLNPAVEFSPDGQRLVAVTYDGKRLALRFLRTDPFRDTGIGFGVAVRPETLSQPAEWITPQMVQVIATGTDGLIRLVDANTGTVAFACGFCRELLAYRDMLIENGGDSIDVLRKDGESWSREPVSVMKNANGVSQLRIVGQKLFGIHANQLRIWDLNKPDNGPQVIRTGDALMLAGAGLGGHYLTISEAGELNVWSPGDLDAPRFTRRIGDAPVGLYPLPSGAAAAILTPGWLHVLTRTHEGGFRFISRPLNGTWFPHVFRAVKAGIRLPVWSGGATRIVGLWQADLSDTRPMDPPAGKTWAKLCDEWSAKLDLQINPDGKLWAKSTGRVIPDIDTSDQP